MTKLEYYNKTCKELFPSWRCVFLKLGITSVRVRHTGCVWDYSVREFNPYNPLSYPIAGLLTIYSIFAQGVPDTIKQLRKAFRYR